MTLRHTSILAYQTIQDNGLLSKRRWQTYEDLYHHGPSTSRDCEDRLKDRNAHRRLLDLVEWGVAEKVGEVKCRKTGQLVTLWDVNEKLPRKPKDGLEVNPLRPSADHLSLVIELLRLEIQKFSTNQPHHTGGHPYDIVRKWLIYQKKLAMRKQAPGSSQGGRPQMSAQETLPEEVIRQEVQNSKLIADRYIKALEKGSIDNERDEEIVTNVMVTAKAKRERTEELRRDATKHLKDQMQEVTNLFFPTIIAWSRVETKARLLLEEAAKKRGVEKHR